MGLLRMAAVGALGYVGWKYYEKAKDKSPPAFDASQEPGENRAKVRDAGPQAMADAADEASDQSFPASDPPANY